MRAKVLLLMAAVAVAPLTVLASEPVDLNVVTRIRDEGLKRSQVMETVRILTDEIGPRITNSPAYREATEAMRSRLAGWGLANAHLEGWEFGRGWSFSNFQVRVLAPRPIVLSAYPKAWTPATGGAVRGMAMRATLDSEEDLEKLAGQVAGKVLFLDETRELEPPDEALFKRFTDEELDGLEEFPTEDRRRSDFRRRYMQRRQLAAKRNAFLVEQGVVATMEISSWDAGMVRVTGNRSYKVGEDPGVPALVMSAEHYNWIVRMLEKKTEVELEILVEASFHEDDTTAHNVIAELPGSDRKGELVLAGAHLDSWHAGTGAADNASGCAVAMEAVRILKAIGVQPRRTIRVGLWASEEQGFGGSRAYVSEHLASRPEPEDPEQREMPSWARRNDAPLEFKPEWEKLSAYFNLDNGSGKIRGIWGQENAAVRPIFEAWLEPFHDLGADTVTLRSTGGTDHQPFDAVGLPAFQFIQDRLDYSTRVHHTQLDVYDRVQAADLKQAAVVMASFLYHAAMRDELLPRKPIPQRTPPAEEQD